MAFKVFESRSNQVGAPAASLTAAGRIRLNKDAAEILKSAGATHVLILWDAENSRMALSSAPASDDRAYKLSYHPKGSGGGLAAKAFLKHIGWNAKDAIPLRLSVQKGMLQADIPSEHINVNEQAPKKKNKGKKPMP